MLFLKILLMIIFFIGSAYEIIIIASFLISWFPRFYGTQVHMKLLQITGPFRKICCGKLIFGSFDIGATLGLMGFGYLLSFLLSLAYSIN